MANLRTTAQQVLEEARDGIAWIALYKEGRGWGPFASGPTSTGEVSLSFTLTTPRSSTLTILNCQ